MTIGFALSCFTAIHKYINLYDNQWLLALANNNILKGYLVAFLLTKLADHLYTCKTLLYFLRGSAIDLIGVGDDLP